MAARRRPPHELPARPGCHEPADGARLHLGGGCLVAVLAAPLRPGSRVRSGRTGGGRARGAHRRRHVGWVRDRRKPGAGPDPLPSQARGQPHRAQHRAQLPASRNRARAARLGAAAPIPAGSGRRPLPDRGRPDLRARVRVRRGRALRCRPLHSHGAADSARIPDARRRHALRAPRPGPDAGGDERRGGGRPRATAPPGSHRDSGRPRLAEARRRASRIRRAPGSASPSPWC